MVGLINLMESNTGIPTFSMKLLKRYGRLFNKFIPILKTQLSAYSFGLWSTQFNKALLVLQILWQEKQLFVIQSGSVRLMVSNIARSYRKGVWFHKSSKVISMKWVVGCLREWNLFLIDLCKSFNTKWW